MLTVINMIDRTNVIDPGPGNGIDFEASLSDPVSKFDFTLDDITQTIKLQDFMPVIVFDENAPAVNGVSPVPSMNFALNALLTQTPGAAFAWKPGGTNGGLIALAGGGSGYVMTFANSPVASGYVQQITCPSVNTGLPVPGYVQPNVAYMWSVYVTGTAPVAIQYFLQINWLDSNQLLLSSVTMTPATPPLSKQRISISGTAPANAVYAQIQFGGQATNATNSGTILFQSVQFEPMWFGWNGVSYPTPDCNFNQADSVQMPDGTTSRKCRIFAGYIEDLIRTYVGKQRYYAVQCASSSKVLETIGLVNASFTNQYDTFIIDAALSNLPAVDGSIGNFQTTQQNQYSPSSTLIQGSLIDSKSYTNVTMRELLNSLADDSGSQFYMDAYYYLWYVPPGFVSATIGLSDTPDNVNTFAYHDFSIEDDGTAPGNTVLVVGNKQKAAVVTDNFTGTGSQTVFNLSFPPENTHVVTVGGSNIRTGVDGVDNTPTNNKFGPSSTFKAIINKQKATIQFATAPANASAVVVSYTYEDQVIAQVLSADAIAQQGGVPFTILINDSNITSTVAAKHRGLAQLTRNAFPRQILTLSALNIYVPVGSIILFTCQAEAMVAAPFTVQTVKANPQGGGVYKWDYTAGAYNPTIIDHIRNIHKAVKRSPTTANVVVIASTDVAIFDSFVINDSVVVNANGAPAAGPYKYNSAKYGFSTYG